MTYPKLRPSSRDYIPGDWAQKRYKALSGAETRIRYGDKRTDAKLTLQYQNVQDTEADDFLAHYDSVFGTFQSFTLPTEALAGWTGTSYIPNVSAMQFRYSDPPQIKSVSPGVSSVSIKLVGVI